MGFRQFSQTDDRRVADRIDDAVENPAAAGPVRASVRLPGSKSMTNRALVLAALAEHLTNAEIGARLFISVRTVESHVSSLLRKLQVGDRRALAAAASTLRPAPATAPGAVAARLPSPLTPFVGRLAERAALAHALDAHRLVTAVGPGGVGKTRLALSVVADVTDRFTGGAWVVDLVPITDLSMIAPAIAEALGLGEHQGRSAEDTIGGWLAAREALLAHARARLGQVTHFVHSASPPRREADHALAVSSETWAQMHAVNVDAGFHLARELARKLIAAREPGSFLFLTSLHAGTPRNLPHYSTAKAALAMLVKELAKTYGRFGIRVNALVPGAVAAGGFVADPALKRHIPLGRLGRSEDLAPMTLAVLSNRVSAYVTGAAIVVDGGLSLMNWFDAPDLDDL